MRDLVYLASTPDEFSRQVGLALEENDSVRRNRRREVARRESWASRADVITEALNTLVPFSPAPETSRQGTKEEPFEALPRRAILAQY